jgi:hypothetical protein
MIEQAKLLDVKTGTRDLSMLSALLWGAAVFFSAPAPLQAEMQLSNYGAVAADVQSSVTQSSNIFRNSDELDDTIFQLMPRVRYRFDQGSVHVEADAGVNVIRYDDFDINDAEDIKSNIVINFPYSDSNDKKRYDVRLQGGYNEKTTPDDSVQDIVQSDELNVSVHGRYYVSERTFVRSGGEWLDRQSQTAGYEDVQRFAVPIEFFYDYSQVLSYGVGYRYTETDVTGDQPEADSEDHALFLAAVGQVASALTAEVRIGGQAREFDSDVYDDETVFFMESLLTWEASALTTVELNVGNGFDTDLNGVSKETLFAQVGAQHQLSNQLRALIGFGYEEVSYSNNRDDEQFSAAIGAVYTLIEDQLEFEGGVRYADRDSTQARSQYDVLSAEISLSYLF